MILECTIACSVLNWVIIVLSLHPLSLHWEDLVCLPTPTVRHFAVHCLGAWNVILHWQASTHTFPTHCQFVHDHCCPPQILLRPCPCNNASKVDGSYPVPRHRTW